MAASMQNVPRFTVMNDDDLEEFMECTDSKNTKKQIKYGLSIFKEYCELCNVKLRTCQTRRFVNWTSFCRGSTPVLARRKGRPNSAKTMHCIMFALQRHFLAVRSVTLDIKGKEFLLLLFFFMFVGRI